MAMNPSSIEPAPVAAVPALGTSFRHAEAVAAGFLLGYRGRTREAYQTDLRDFGAWCASVELDPLEAARGHVEAYARHLEEVGRSPATVARRLSTLGGFYRYALAEGHIPRSPVEHVRRPRVGQDSPRLGLDRAEAVGFLDQAEGTDPRDHALACLLTLNGLRVSEACEANIEDLGQQRGHRTLTVTRKGGRREEIPLAPRTVAAIDAHLGGRASGPLLLSNDGGRLNRFDAARIVRRLARAADIRKAISPHSLRHTAVTLALDAGVSLRDAQDLAGHSDPRTTRRYDRARNSLDRHATYRLASYLSEEG
jgi:integrase/recombinase XerD